MGAYDFVNRDVVLRKFSFESTKSNAWRVLFHSSLLTPLTLFCSSQKKHFIYFCKEKYFISRRRKKIQRTSKVVNAKKMGISKSIKGLFMKKKSKLDVESSSTDSGIKSPKTKPKRRQSKVYEAKNALVSTQAAGRPKYGAYNEANAKLVTAEGNYPSNYEHYSGFEPRKTKKMGILKGT